MPTVPGSDSRIANASEASRVAAAVGFPVMIKAAAGGGGRGIRIVEDAKGFDQVFTQASYEAAAAFGDGGLYIEKVIERARHVEVQILGDGKDFVHCFERECSLQRRRQKAWEEAPAVGLGAEVRARLCEGAVALAREVGYRGAGTVEYLFDDDAQSLYFLEVNTRIQVEHPVTEMVTGIDLVAEMIRIAGGEPRSLRQDEITATGHAIECRINAGDPAMAFAPFPGIVSSPSVPEHPAVRFGSLLYEGYTVPPFYDSLLGKLVVHGADRQACLATLREALGSLEIGGLKTTIPLHVLLSRDADVAAGATHTRFLKNWLDRHFGQ